MGDIFGGSRLVYFGEDIRYSQRNNFTFKPSVPNLFNIKRFVDFGLGYNADYAWQNSLTKGDIGKSVAANGTFTFTMNVRLKSIFDPLFEDSAPATASVPSRGRRTEDTETQTGSDSTRKAASDSLRPSVLTRSLAQVKNIIKILVKYPFLDYDNISVSFSQNNNG